MLVESGANGPRLAIEYIARYPRKLPIDLAPTVVVLLKNKAGPAPIRIAATGNILASLPDTIDAIRPVLAALTAGLSRTLALERLIRLQGRVSKCNTLDRIVTATEEKLKLKCPKCAAKLTRTGLILHLWHKHRLVFVKGKARDPQVLVEKAMTAGATATADSEPDPDRIDAAFGLTGLYFPKVPPSQVFQALAARGAVLPAQLDPLLDRAAEVRCGLCPVCLSPLADPIPLLPPRLAIGGGRLAGDGFAVDVLDTPTGRTVTITTRGGTTTEAGAKRLTPRAFAVRVGVPFLVIAVGLGLFLPARIAPPIAVAGLVTVVGWLAYFSARFLRKPLANPTDVAVERAWEQIVPDLGRKPPAVRFLTRLCRSSIGNGNIEERTPNVRDLVEHAAAQADRGVAHMQLLAAVRVLQVCDAATLGREKIAGLLSVFEPFVRGELPMIYGEAAAESLMTAGVLTSGEAERLAVMLIRAAFDSGYLPSDLLMLMTFAPWIRRLLRDPAPAHLRALHWLWRNKHLRRWEEVGSAKTVFDVAETSPNAAKKVLGQYPDAVLRIEVDDAIEEELGPVLVCSSGIVVGGATVADPDAAVQLSANGRELQFGSHRIGLDRKASAKLVQLLRGWLKFRARVMIPGSEHPEPRSGPSRASGVLAPLALQCPLCSEISVVRSGKLGVKWNDVVAGRVVG